MYRNTKPLPTIPKLLAYFKSSTNVQVTDNRFQKTYLANYAAGKEENRSVEVIVGRGKEVQMKGGKIRNEKLASTPKVHAQVREICYPELVCNNLGFEYVWSNVDFVHLTTLPLEYRTGVMKARATTHSKVNSVTDGPKPIYMRRDFPAWRKCTQRQETLIGDYLNSLYWLDKVSKFSLRPPELLIFDTLELFFECFQIKGSVEYRVDPDLALCPWICGNGERVKLRESGVQEAVAFLTSKQQTDFRARLLLQEVFEGIARGEEDLVSRFVAPNTSRDAIVVFSTVNSSVANQYYAHVLFRFGHFETELDLLLQPSMSEAFRNAGLITDPRSDDDWRKLLKRLIMEEEKDRPVSTERFCRSVMEVVQFLKSIRANRFHQAFSYSVNENMIREQATAKLKELEEKRRNDLIVSLTAKQIPHMPTEAELKQATIATPLPWTPMNNPQNPQQTDASFEEQKECMELVLHSIQQYKEGDSMRNIIINGKN